MGEFPRIKFKSINNYLKWFHLVLNRFLIIGGFNAFGIAEGSVDSRIGKLKELRLAVHSDSENWVILSEVGITFDWEAQKIWADFSWSEKFQKWRIHNLNLIFLLKFVV
jgi:hypothetical protein